MAMRNEVEMRHVALLSRQILKQENNVKITNFLGGYNIFATLSLSLVLANSTSLDTHAHTRQDKAFHAFMQGKPFCFYAHSETWTIHHQYIFT